MFFGFIKLIGGLFMVKKCTNCGIDLKNEVVFCSSCGTKQEILKENFCVSCGEKSSSDIKFCPHCGSEKNTGKRKNEPNQNVNSQYTSNYSANNNDKGLMAELSKRVKTSSILGIILGGLQIFIALLSFVDLSSYRYSNEDEILFGTFIILLVGGANLFVSIRWIKMSKAMLVGEIDVIKEFKPAGMYIGTIVWNGFLFLSVLLQFEIFSFLVVGYGVAVTIIDYIYIRSFVVRNEKQFSIINS